MQTFKTLLTVLLVGCYLFGLTERITAFVQQKRFGSIEQIAGAIALALGTLTLGLL